MRKQRTASAKRNVDEQERVRALLVERNRFGLMAEAARVVGGIDSDDMRRFRLRIDGFPAEKLGALRRFLEKQPAHPAEDQVSVRALLRERKHRGLYLEAARTVGVTHMRTLRFAEGRCWFPYDKLAALRAFLLTRPPGEELRNTVGSLVQEVRSLIEERYFVGLLNHLAGELRINPHRLTEIRRGRLRTLPLDQLTRLKVLLMKLPRRADTQRYEARVRARFAKVNRWGLVPKLARDLGVSTHTLRAFIRGVPFPMDRLRRFETLLSRLRSSKGPTVDLGQDQERLRQLLASRYTRQLGAEITQELGITRRELFRFRAGRAALAATAVRVLRSFLETGSSTEAAQRRARELLRARHERGEVSLRAAGRAIGAGTGVMSRFVHGHASLPLGKLGLLASFLSQVRVKRREGEGAPRRRPGHQRSSRDT